MKFLFGPVGLLRFAVLGAALATSGAVWANGEEFFLPAGNGKVDLVYFGHIKDQDGNVIKDASIIVSAKDVGMVFPFQSDLPGHYRSPDIGAAIKEIGENPDPTRIEIVCAKAGYKQIKPVKVTVPNKAAGTIEIDFILAKETAAAN